MASGTLLSLPPELLYRIFDHFNSKTIFLSIRAVCKRLYAVTETYNRFVLDIECDSKSESKLICRLVNPPNIRSLTITDDTYRIYRTNSDISFIDMQQFTELRSLTFHNISGRELERLLPCLKLNALDSLSITIPEFGYQKASTLLSLAIYHFNPRQLFFASLNPVTIDSFPSVNCKLEHLTLDKCDISRCLTILLCLPRLHTCILNKCTICKDVEVTLPLSDISFSSSLTSLTIYECSLSTKLLASLLTLTPGLVYLRLTLNRDIFDCIFDGFYWEEFIPSKLPLLKTFEFFFSFDVKTSDPVIDIDSHVTSFQTEFWLNQKNWIVNCAYIISASAIGFYTNKFRIPCHYTSLKCEISTTDNVWRFTQGSRHETSAATVNEVGIASNICRNELFTR